MALMSVLSRSTAPAPRPARRLRLPAWLPHDVIVSDADFTARHRLVLWVLGAHIPALMVFGVLTGHTILHSALESLLPAVFLLGGLASRVDRRIRGLLASTGLLTCSAVLVHFADGQTEAHFHYFVAVALIAVYQDWTVYLLAIAFVGLQHGLMGTFDTDTVFDHGGNSWLWAGVHSGFILALSAVNVLFWNYNEQTRRRERAMRDQLFEGQTSLASRLEETNRIRTDLIGTVSHEFRTPLTGIRAATLTLLKRGDRLDADSRNRLLHAVLAQEERLSRLLENMLIAASAKPPDPDAITDVHQVASEVAMLAHATHPQTPEVSVAVPPYTLARIDRQALHQVLANLVDNAQQHGASAGVPLIAGGVDGDETWFSVSNEGSDVDETVAARLFEPFTQADTSATRGAEGIGMGLYVVRRLVQVHGGHIILRSDSGWLTVEVRLPSVMADPVEAPADHAVVRTG